ncbi:DUF1800 domain-containing protein [Nocardioides sp.]|uniref:DUF1800 domain-containing protein n=1 Tax=Nocardioides sp. TaxID=35761 RepID=UPI002629C52A|nr:DUF1800 domain-containing protein [Nocardioides sp.]
MPTPPAVTSRRALVAGAGSVGAAAVVGVGAGPAQAAYKPRRYRGKPLLGAADRHLVNRFSYGNTPSLTRQVRRAGGGRTWFEKQLQPGRIKDGRTDALEGWWPSLTRSPQDLWNRQVQEVEGGWQVMADYQRWILMRRVTTNRPVWELMAEFWMNHFNVPVHHDATFTHRFDFDRVVRRYALTSFEELLRRAVTHPAMGIFLDAAVSTKEHPNENLGRELLELHTVGYGQYDESDVKDSARILTGYLVDMWGTWEASYSPRDHWTGAVSVLGFTHANKSADGRAVAEAFLAHLARHPATARRIARKLCVTFVRDEPSQALVDHLAEVYLRNDTAIKPVLRALVASSEFKKSGGLKVREPSAEIVATYRALRVRISDPPAGDNGFAARVILWQAEAIGAVPFDWPRPDGPPADNAAWSSPARLLASMDTHWAMSGGWWPSEGIRYRTARAWLPRKRLRYDLLVDHLSQQLLGRRSSSRLLQACVEVCPDEWKIRPSTKITMAHPLMKWGFHRVIATILDSPDHFTR